MNQLIHDASAILAVIFEEPGVEVVMECLAEPGGVTSAVNWSEVGAKLAERGLPGSSVSKELAALGLDIIPVDETQANIAAMLRPEARKLGLSLGNRCCLALAQTCGAQVVTADAAWLQLQGFDMLAARGP